MRRRTLLATPLLAPLAAPLGAAAQVQAARHPMPERGRRAWAQQIPQIRIGILGGENEADRMGRYGAYGRLIEETFGVPVRLFQSSDYGGVVQAFVGRHVQALLIVGLLAIAWGAPNAYQILGRFSPALGRVQEGRPAWLRWQPSTGWLAVVLLLLLVSVMNLHREARFLYFQF